MKSNVPFLAKSVIGVGAVIVAENYWDWLTVESIEDAILVGVVMQACLSFFMWLESFSAQKWQQQGNSKLHKIGRAITSYISLVGGKFITMAIIGALFGSAVVMEGYLNGIVVFFGLIFLILGLEKLMGRLFFQASKAIST